MVYTSRQEIYSRLIKMKENEKAQIKLLSDRLDLTRHQMAGMLQKNETEKYAELEKEKAALETDIARLKEQRSKKLSNEARNSAKKHKSWWICRSSALSLRKNRLISAS